MNDTLGTLQRHARQDLDALIEHGVPALGKRPRGHRGWMAMVKAAVLEQHTGADPHPEAREAAGRWLGELEALQAPDGLFASGDNLASPPDSAFTINDAALTAAFLRRQVPDGAAADGGVGRRIEQVMARALPALISGGVHTPNHRWELASALVAAGDLLGGDPARAAADRARDWLGEGIDVDADALYSERSPNYAAYVSNPALLTLAQRLGRPELTSIVHRNLHAQLDLTAPGGGIETIHSRRQDQLDGPFPLGPFAAHFAVFAAACPRCRSGARRALGAPDLDAVDLVMRSVLDERVAAGLRAAARSTAQHDEAPVDRWFAGPRLWRRSDGRVWSSVYGGSDVPAAGRIGSGLATNPTFLRAGWGAVEVTSVRLSRDFFSMGPFRAERAEHAGDRLVLRESLSASYYQPLPARSRNAAGDYRLEHEGRFAAAMAFSERARDEVHLDTVVTFAPGPEGSAELDIETQGAASGHTLEIALAAGSSIEGARDLGGGRHLLTGATTVRRGADTVVLDVEGPSDPDLAPAYDPGEAYTFLGGTDAVDGLRLYLTWRSPAAVRLRIREGVRPTTEKTDD